jgi:hypothetical protein
LHHAETYRSSLFRSLSLSCARASVSCVYLLFSPPRVWYKYTVYISPALCTPAIGGFRAQSVAPTRTDGINTPLTVHFIIKHVKFNVTCLHILARLITLFFMVQRRFPPTEGCRYKFLRFCDSEMVNVSRYIPRKIVQTQAQLPMQNKTAAAKHNRIVAVEKLNTTVGRFKWVPVGPQSAPVEGSFHGHSRSALNVLRV